MCILGYFAIENYNNKSIEVIELNKIPRDIWTSGALNEMSPATATNQLILRRILGILDIYVNCRTVVDIYILGRWQEITGETLFFSNFILFTTVNIA